MPYTGHSFSHLKMHAVGHTTGIAEVIERLEHNIVIDQQIGTSAYIL